MGSLGKNLEVKLMSEAQAVENQPRQAGNVVTSENLAEFAATKLGLATEPSPTAADPVDDKSGSEPAASEGESGQGAEDEAKATDEGKKSNPKLEKRFSELTKQRKEAEARAEAERQARIDLEARLAALEGQKVQATAPISNSEPQPEQFKDAFEYAKALATWSAEQAVLKRDQEEAAKAEQAEKQQVLKTWADKLEAVKEELPDYEEMVASSTVAVSDAVRDAILESDVGPKILYELASNDKLAAKISSMNTAQVLREIGKLEAKFELQTEPSNQKPVVRQSKAPEPINPIRAGGGAPDVRINAQGEYKGSYAQWKADRKAGKIR